MIQLAPLECRVLGTLVEKAQTTPNLYPLTLNALTAGCNQKNNRDPVLEVSEEEVLDVIDSLKAKGLAREAIMSGSRVNKFKHVMRDALSINLVEMAVLTELLLRGPQSAGELKTRCERLVPSGTTPGVGSPEAVLEVLAGLMQRDEPMVRRLERRPGERSERYVQLLCPNLHRLDGPVAVHATDHPRAGQPTHADAAAMADVLDQLRRLTERLDFLEQRVKTLEI
ncbi:MAG: YceH family protein [Phycisphaerales bacterium]